MRSGLLLEAGQRSGVACSSSSRRAHTTCAAQPVERSFSRRSLTLPQQSSHARYGQPAGNAGAPGTQRSPLETPPRPVVANRGRRRLPPVHARQRRSPVISPDIVIGNGEDQVCSTGHAAAQCTARRAACSGETPPRQRRGSRGRWLQQHSCGSQHRSARAGRRPTTLPHPQLAATVRRCTWS